MLGALIHLSAALHAAIAVGLCPDTLGPCVEAVLWVVAGCTQSEQLIRLTPQYDFVIY